MNRNIITLDDLSTNAFNHNVGEQPRKSMSRKNKKAKTFAQFEYETDEINEHRESYKRASAKYATRLQLRSSEIIN